jgi:hypothetical protein
MANEDLTVDEAMQDILAALNDLHNPVIPEGYKSIDEIMQASGSKLSRKQMTSNLNETVNKGLMDKQIIGRYAYYKAK